MQRFLSHDTKSLKSSFDGEYNQTVFLPKAFILLVKLDLETF